MQLTSFKGLKIILINLNLNIMYVVHVASTPNEPSISDDISE